jgi:hypothetical protein
MECDSLPPCASNLTKIFGIRVASVSAENMHLPFPSSSIPRLGAEPNNMALLLMATQGRIRALQVLIRNMANRNWFAAGIQKFGHDHD